MVALMAVRRRVAGICLCKIVLQQSVTLLFPTCIFLIKVLDIIDKEIILIFSYTNWFNTLQPCNYFSNISYKYM
jgi:hypothetical protein